MSKIEDNKEIKETPVVRKYALLQETSGEECESWYYFIKYQGNEEALDHLNKQLSQIEWFVEDGLSTFDLELDYLVSEQTAKEMTKVDINHTSFHRKFDGTLKKIDFKLKPDYKEVKKMEKVYAVLGYGGIENFIDQEDLDPEDMPTGGEEDSSDDSEDSEVTDDSDSEESEDSEASEEKKTPKKKGSLPVKPKIEIPRVAQAKQHKKRH